MDACKFSFSILEQMTCDNNITDKMSTTGSTSIVVGFSSGILKISKHEKRRGGKTKRPKLFRHLVLCVIAMRFYS